MGLPAIVAVSRPASSARRRPQERGSQDLNKRPRPESTMSDATPRGQTLHREFVGMLFALAIAEVAVRSGEIVNSDLSALTKAPALSHLLLAAMVIATSWVGWGWSK